MMKKIIFQNYKNRFDTFKIKINQINFMISYEECSTEFLVIGLSKKEASLLFEGFCKVYIKGYRGYIKIPDFSLNALKLFEEDLDNDVLKIYFVKNKLKKRHNKLLNKLRKIKSR